MKQAVRNTSCEHGSLIDNTDTASAVQITPHCRWNAIKTLYVHTHKADTCIILGLLFGECTAQYTWWH